MKLRAAGPSAAQGRGPAGGGSRIVGDPIALIAKKLPVRGFSGKRRVDAGPGHTKADARISWLLHQAKGAIARRARIMPRQRSLQHRRLHAQGGGAVHGCGGGRRFGRGDQGDPDFGIDIRMEGIEKIVVKRMLALRPQGFHLVDL